MKLSRKMYGLVEDCESVIEDLCGTVDAVASRDWQNGSYGMSEAKATRMLTEIRRVLSRASVQIERLTQEKS